MSTKAKEHRFPGKTDTLEKLADDDLRPDTEEGHHCQDKTPIGNTLQLRIGGKSANDRRREEQADDPAERSDRRGDPDSQFEPLPGRTVVRHS